MTLDLDDLRELKGEEFVEKLDFKGKLKELNRTADTLVLAYMQQENALSADFVAQRLKEINNG